MTNPDNVGGLPALPLHMYVVRQAPCYTADQMRAYGELCRAAPAGGDEETVREVYWMGWMNCAAWTDRYDLLADRGSNAYLMLEDDVVARYAKRDSAPAGSGEVENMARALEELTSYPDGKPIEDDGEPWGADCRTLRATAALLRKLQQGAE